MVRSAHKQFPETVAVEIAHRGETGSRLIRSRLADNLPGVWLRCHVLQIDAAVGRTVRGVRRCQIATGHDPDRTGVRSGGRAVAGIVPPCADGHLRPAVAVQIAQCRHARARVVIVVLSDELPRSGLGSDLAETDNAVHHAIGGIRRGQVGAGHEVHGVHATPTLSWRARFSANNKIGTAVCVQVRHRQATTGFGILDLADQFPGVLPGCRMAEVDHLIGAPVGGVECRQIGGGNQIHGPGVRQPERVVVRHAHDDVAASVAVEIARGQHLADPVSRTFADEPVG